MQNIPLTILNISCKMKLLVHAIVYIQKALRHYGSFQIKHQHHLPTNACKVNVRLHNVYKVHYILEKNTN